MAQVEVVRCQKCGREVAASRSSTHGSQVLCEDCYMEASQRVQTCDPLAVRSAQHFRKASGLEGTEGLTELQRTICEFIKHRGRVTVHELYTTFHLSPRHLENQIAILRHCELVRGEKEGDTVYLAPFE